VPPGPYVGPYRWIRVRSVAAAVVLKKMDAVVVEEVGAIHRWRRWASGSTFVLLRPSGSGRWSRATAGSSSSSPDLVVVAEIQLCGSSAIEIRHAPRERDREDHHQPPCSP
jgi:hypothetical protein